MRAYQLILFLVTSTFIFAACSAGEPERATLVPTIATTPESVGISGESPRTGEGDPGSGLPPTWTPAPTVDGPAAQPALATRQPDETYIVQPGDTLAEIAEAFSVELDRLARANDIINIDFIYTGQVLTIPR